MLYFFQVYLGYLAVEKVAIASTDTYFSF